MATNNYSEWKVPRFICSEHDRRHIVAYRKDQVYADDYERSFEELRARGWMKQRVLRLTEQRQLGLAREQQLQETVQQQAQQLLTLQQRVAELQQQLETASSAVAAAPSSHLMSNSLSGAAVSSPTVNTREALNFVRAACDATMETMNFGGGGGTCPVQRAPASAPFSVYVDDDGRLSPPPPPPQQSAPLPVETADDKENLPPRQAKSTEWKVPVASQLLQQQGAAGGGSGDEARPLQFDCELTGFKRLPDVTMMLPDPEMFRAGAARVSSTPMVGPAKERVEEEEFTANVNMYRQFMRPGQAAAAADATPALVTIMEGSREDRFRNSNSSGAASDPSCQTEFSVPRPTSAAAAAGGTTGGGGDASAGLVNSCHHQPAPAAVSRSSFRSGYLADRSSQRSTVDHPHCLSPCRPGLLSDTLPAHTPVAPRVLPVSRDCGAAPQADTVPCALSELSLSVQPPEDFAESLADAEQDAADCSLDPWSDQLVSSLLDSVRPALADRGLLVDARAEQLPDFGQKRVQLAGESWRLSTVGTGAYARVFQAVSEQAVACFKVQQSDARWEVYIVDEVRRRRGEAQCLGAIMPVSAAFLYTGGTVICTELVEGGTLLDLRNRSEPGPCAQDALAMLLTAEMLANVQLVHSAGVIHGDVKPDNFLVRLDALQAAVDQMKVPAAAFPPSPLLQLIDFGRAIDLQLLAPGTTFRRRVDTQCFVCPEMLSDRPWTFQTDLFGVVATAYLLLFGEYLKLRVPRAGSRWSLPPGHDLKRYWRTAVWRRFFDEFLNIASCHQLPDLVAWRATLLEAATADLKLRDQLSMLLVRLKQR